MGDELSWLEHLVYTERVCGSATAGSDNVFAQAKNWLCGLRSNQTINYLDNLQLSNRQCSRNKC